MSGVYDTTQVAECSPVATAELLEGKDKIAAGDLKAAITSGPAARVTALALGGASMDDAALDELKAQLPELSALEVLDLSNSTGFTSSALKELLSACCGCDTLKKVSLSGCGLKAADVAFITSDVAPWSESIVEWDLSNNPLVGGASILSLVTGIANRPIQAVNLSNTGVTDGRHAAAILSEILNMPHVFQIGLTKNSGFLAPALKANLAELDELLKANADMAGIRDRHQSVSEAIGKEAGDAKKKQDAEAEVTAAASAAAAAKAAKAAKKTSSPLKKRAGSPAPTPATTSAPKQPTIASSTIKRGGSPARKPSTPTTVSPTPVAKSPVRRAASPSIARSSTPTAHNQSSAARSPSRSNISQAVSQKDVADGYQQWLDIKAKYNESIHSGRKKTPAEASPSAPKYYTYKYAFGQNVDAQKTSGSRAFHNTTVVRDPTSQELRELAPWVTDKNFVSCPGRTIYIDDPKHPGRKIRFVDGGEIRDVANDFREIGFVARKRESGQLNTSRTGGFASNTPREVRFGTDASNEIIRRAQAPGPGAYYVKSQFELNADKALVNAANRPGFGSKSERMIFKKPLPVDQQPAAFYEIP